MYFCSLGSASLALGGQTRAAFPRVDKDGYFTIIGDEKNDRGNEHEIDIDEIIAGHLDFIISEIGK